MNSKFKYTDKGKAELAVLIPGWAMDWRVFEKLDIEYNYLVPYKIDLDDFFESLEENLGRERNVLLMGWSFGGVLGAHFMIRYPEAVKCSVFIGVKEKYPAAEMEKMKTYLAKNKETYLRKFYRRCLRGHDAEDAGWFNSRLLESYLGKPDIRTLAVQLDYLAANPLPINELKEYEDKILFVRGADDAVIPEAETKNLKKHFPAKCFRELPGTGHLAVLNDGQGIG